MALEAIPTVVVMGTGPGWVRALPNAATVPLALNSQKPRPLGLEAIPLTGPKPVGAGQPPGPAVGDHAPGAVGDPPAVMDRAGGEAHRLAHGHQVLGIAADARAVAEATMTLPT